MRSRHGLVVAALVALGTAVAAPVWAGEPIPPDIYINRQSDNVLIPIGGSFDIGTTPLGTPIEAMIVVGNAENSGTLFIYQVTAPTTVYRVWTAAKAYTQLGGWWSFTAPRGPRAAYQRDNAICAEWSALDTVSSCTIKLGTRIVVGPGQSADCEGDADFAASATNQVFIPNDTRKGQLFVEGCTAGVPWPAAAAP